MRRRSLASQLCREVKHAVKGLFESNNMAFAASVPIAKKLYNPIRTLVRLVAYRKARLPKVLNLLRF